MTFDQFVASRAWPDAEACYRAVHGASRLSRERIHALYQAVRWADATGLVGQLVECGVAAGGSAATMGIASRASRPLWLYDSFRGMPEPSEHDPPAARQEVGRCEHSAEEAARFLGLFGLLPTTRLVPGWYEDTLPRAAPALVAVLHIDCDWYESVKAVLDAFYDRIVPGGVVQIDDYGHWEGCRKATDEFFAARGIDPCLHKIDYTGVRHVKGATL